MVNEITLETIPSLKVDELKAALKVRGCSFGPKDKKVELVAKLVAFVEGLSSKAAESSSSSSEAPHVEDLATSSDSKSETILPAGLKFEIFIIALIHWYMYCRSFWARHRGGYPHGQTCK